MTAIASRAATMSAPEITTRIDRATSVLPKAVELARGQLGVPDCVLNVPVLEVMLQGPGVLPIICEFEAAGVAQHVRVNRERQRVRLADPRKGLT
jgi:hypothetical protein